MRRLPLLVLLALLAPAPADAQGVRDDEAVGRRGDVALAFQAYWLGVEPFMGGIGGRYWVDDRTVLTGSVGAGLHTRTTDLGANDDEDDAYRLGVGLGIERHLRSRRSRVSPFLALGAEFAVLRQESVRTREDGETVGFERSSQSVGAAGFVGVEYRFAPALTLSAAHSVGVRYEWGREALYDPDRLGETNDFGVVHVGTGLTALVLSVYF